MSISKEQLVNICMQIADKKIKEVNPSDTNSGYLYGYRQGIMDTALRLLIDFQPHIHPESFNELLDRITGE